jgi:hypothetical protein
MFLSVVGVYILYKKHGKAAALLISIVGVNILLYSMWGDPWGGWAFGSRYLIPSYSILSIFLSISLSGFRKRFGLLVLFLLFTYYSVAVNSLGALTTNKIPPKGEALALEPISGRKEYYTYLRNWEHLHNSGVKSFAWQAYLKDYLTAPQYYFVIAGSIMLVFTGQVTYLYLKARKET